MTSHTIGMDFGTGSMRAVLVEVATGRELASAVHPYPHGVIDRHLPAPDDDVVLGPDWALQHPGDYLEAIEVTVPAVLAQAGVDPHDVVGVGIDFTSCTMLPTTADGTPLSELPEFRRSPHAWVKLWKHHAAQLQADRINQVARERGEPWLARYGGKISSEWFVAKSLQILEEAPEVYDAADRLIEAADWIVWQLTGRETRSSCTAGYKAMWSKEHGFPPEDFFAALDERFAGLVDDKMSRDVGRLGDRAGGLSTWAAEQTGLAPDTAVAIANVDAHVSVPAATVTEPGRLVAVMGTSTCHLLLGEQAELVEGMCGVVEDGIVPDLFGYEAGQSAVGDIFAWFVDNAVPPVLHDRAVAEGVDVHTVLEQEAGHLAPGESGLLALDWWGGNRSVLVDADLTGLLVGATLATRPAEVYRALIEATAFGTRLIIEEFIEAGVPVDDFVACGGLPRRNRLLMQVYADVTGMDIRVAASSETPALGSAMFAAVAAGADQGGHDTIADAVAAMARLADEVYRPVEANVVVYDDLFREYRRLHDHFGRGGNDVMKTLKDIRARARAGRRAGAAEAAEASGASGAIVDDASTTTGGARHG